MNEKVFFVASSNAVSDYNQGKRCLSAVFFALLTYWHIQVFWKCLPYFFLHKLTSIYRQNWCCEKILKSQNSDKAASFSSVVVNIASSVQKVSYSKPLHNKSRCLDTKKSFLTFKVINTWIFLYLQNVLTMKLWQNTQSTTAILFCFTCTAQHGEYLTVIPRAGCIESYFYSLPFGLAEACIY